MSITPAQTRVPSTWRRHAAVHACSRPFRRPHWGLLKARAFLWSRPPLGAFSRLTRFSVAKVSRPKPGRSTTHLHALGLRSFVSAGIFFGSRADLLRGIRYLGLRCELTKSLVSLPASATGRGWCRSVRL